MAASFVIVPAQRDHIAALKELARSVEPLFGPMLGHGFEKVLDNNIERNALLCAIDSTSAGNDIKGAIIFDTRDAPTYQVSWLAVFEACRGTGVGRALLTAALERVAPPASVDVVTFGPDNAAGIPARRLYESFGFRPGAMRERGPEGGTRQAFELRLG